MWHKIIGMVVIGVMLCVQVNPQTVHAESRSTETRARVDAQAAKILADGDASDMIPVIITLQANHNEFARSESAPIVDKQQRANTVRILQQDFVGRNASRIQVTPRQPTLNPIVLVSMQRQDILALAADSAVISVQEDKPARVMMDESTVIIGSVTANTSGYDGRGMSVAVLDTGVMTNHEFLAGQVVAESCFSNAYGEGPEWYNGTSLCPSGTSTTNDTANDVGSAAPCVGYSGCDHGTHVAGTVAGKVTNKGSYTLRGVAPGAKIIGVQVFTYLPDADPTTDGAQPTLSSWTADQILAMDWLLTNMDTLDWGTLAALNMSLGGGESATTCDAENGSPPDGSGLKAYIDDLRSLRVATVIASGNESMTDKISSPACISSAIAVGATTTTSAILEGYATAVDEVASFSNAPITANNAANANGDRLLDLLAPGFFINSSITTSTTAYDYKPGTSMATPHVAGAWAVMRQAAPTASVTQILRWLYSSGKSITDSRNGLVLPRINVNNAVTLAITPQAFGKTAPAVNAVNQPLNVTLTWPASSGATSYEYCFAFTAAKCIYWKSVGNARSVVMSGLRSRTTYFWHVRARNAKGVTVSNGGVWKFTTTTVSMPGAFAKTAPANIAVNQPLTVTLSWGASVGVRNYEYCFAFTAANCTNWKSVGTARSVVMSGLRSRTTYFWQVRSRNAAGDVLANGGVWRFTTR
jgi:subtilisin family serine protease